MLLAVKQSMSKEMTVDKICETRTSTYLRVRVYLPVMMTLVLAM